jgi:2-keto-4-pentenoate hydratase
MEPAKVRDAARLLVEARRTGKRVPGLPTRPSSRRRADTLLSILSPALNELRRGPGLQAGQVVATGSFSGFFPVQANQQIVADFDGIGQATAMLVP